MSAYVLMGVSGCGKSSVGAAVAARTGVVFVDGDDLHPKSNIAKMARGEPLTDADRAPWLRAVGDCLAAAKGPTAIGCSALKRAYRDLIRSRVPGTVHFLHLTGARSVLEQRMTERTGHFMPASLLDSQLATLEPLGDDEAGCAIDIDAPLDDVVGAAVQYLKETVT